MWIFSADGLRAVNTDSGVVLITRESLLEGDRETPYVVYAESLNSSETSAEIEKHVDRAHAVSRLKVILKDEVYS